MKLDLHTHIFEEFLPIYGKSNIFGIVEKLVEKTKSLGLDGVAITEHNDKLYGHRVKEIVEHYFNSEVLVIPGREIERWPMHLIELDLPCNSGVVTFRFVAHPGYPGEPDGNFDDIDGIEIENALHNWHLDQARIMNIAKKHDLVLLSNSDAHYLDDVGKYYSKVSIADLCQRAHSFL
ncbi:MAG: PHP domain-containing protein [Dehalococcoidia bacterium]